MYFKHSIVFVIMSYFYMFGWSALTTVYAKTPGISTHIGKDKSFIINAIGAPVKESDEEHYHILWFGSIAPSQATFYYFSQNTVKYISSYIQDKNITLNTYIDQLGIPEKSLYRYSQTLQDSLMQRIHVWPGKGKAVVTSGEKPESLVIREMTFAPVSLDEYFNTWGKDIRNNKEIPPGTPLSTTPVPLTKSRLLLIPRIILVVFIMIPLIIYGMYRIFRHGSNNSQHNENIR